MDTGVPLSGQWEGFLVVSGESLRPPLTGIGQYTRALLKALVDIIGPSVLQVCDDSGIMPATEALAKCHNREHSDRRFFRWLRALPGLYELRHRLRCQHFHRQARHAALYHEPNFILKPFAGPTVVTVHDLSHLAHPEFHPVERVRFLDRHLPATLSRATRILCVSQFTRHELMRLCGITADRIAVTPLAAAPRFRPMPKEEVIPFLIRRGLHLKHYVLSVATFEPRKNLIGLLTAFSSLPPSMRRAFPLVLVGAKGWHDEMFKDQLARLCARGEATVLNYITDEEIPALMSGCRCFVYPSFYEGFGLPVLEAQACGAVTVAANRGALPEIASSCCLLVDPEDSDALSQIIRQAIEDETLANDALVAGPAFAANFSWEKTAIATLAAYQAALHS